MYQKQFAESAKVRCSQ